MEELYLGVPVVKQSSMIWCFPASVQSVLKYAGMEITQSEIAKYCIEKGLGYAYILANNADELEIDVSLKNRTLKEIKEEIIKKRPPIVILEYSLTKPSRHFYVVDGFSDVKQEVRLMCPNRGYMDMSYDEFKKLNDLIRGQECDFYSTTSIWPRDN